MIGNQDGQSDRRDINFNDFSRDIEPIQTLGGNFREWDINKGGETQEEWDTEVLKNIGSRLESRICCTPLIDNPHSWTKRGLFMEVWKYWSEVLYPSPGTKN